MKLVLLIALLVSVSSAQTEPSNWKAPANAAAKTNPLKNKPELAAGGQKLFANNCATCHEAGDKPLGPKLSTPAVQNESDGALFWKISNGNSRTGMPSFSMLPDAQRWQLVLYIRSLGVPKK